MTRKRFIQDPRTGKLVPASEYRRPGQKAHDVLPDIEAFVSPIDQRVITGRAALRAHNAEHGVVQQGEYGPNNGEAYFARAQEQRIARMEGRTPEQRAERLRQIVPIVTERET